MKLLRRPLVLGGLAALAGPGAVVAQPNSGKVWRIGYLSESFPRSGGPFLISRLGYVEGRDFVVDFKFAQGQRERLPVLAAELVAAKPDVLVGPLNREIMALKRATSTIPIVMLFPAGPVELGLIASLSRPGGNITGTSSSVPEMAGKMLQVMHEALPSAKKLVWLSDQSYPGINVYRKSFDAALTRFGLRCQIKDTRTQADLDSALAGLERERPDAMGVSDVGVTVLRAGQIIEAATRLRIPTFHSIRHPVLQGALMSYSPDFEAMLQRVAWMVERILKGAKPADIPVEEPARFLLTINMKTARALGLTIPQKVLLSADELIE